MSEKETFYITTPIYYPSAKFTLGHCYTTIICDALARFNRMRGKDVFFLTGTDEHGQKIAKSAKEAGKTEMEYVTSIVEDAKDLWKLLDISYDKFIRTTDEYHVEAVKKIFNKLYEQGDIYKGHYKGLYCTPCESFWTEEQLVDGKCPDCGRPVIEASEDAYFFRLSKYADKILELYKNDPEFLQPKNRVNEMVNNFLKPGLKDLCVTRQSVKWGIPIDIDPNQTIYVWLDALNNYITALGYMSEDDSLFKKYWPANVHMVGKEIVRFHAITWPAILIALGLPLPKRVFAHGWLVVGGDKLSKSKDSGVKDVLDPRILAPRYGIDAIRLFLLKEIPFGQDGNYTQELFLNAINNSLANEFGNLVSRTVGMIQKYCSGHIDNPNESTQLDIDFKQYILNKRDEIFLSMDKLQVSDAINQVFDIFRRCNKYIDENEPWILSKDESKKNRLATMLYTLSEAIIIGSTLLISFLPDKAKNVFSQFGQKIPTDFDNIKNFGFMNNSLTVEKGENIYPRLDIKKEMEELSAICNK